MAKKLDKNIGRIFGDRYEIINVVGSGGSSVVYGVYDIVGDKTVAMKMLLQEYEGNADAIRRFEQEAEILSLFSHPGIVKLYDKSLDGFPKYFIMEYVEGITLKKHILNKGALSKSDILRIIKPTLSALAEVHSKGIVHSDIKPHNVVVLADGSIRLMDFGISKSLPKKIIDLKDGEEPSEVAIGTVHYVSPEQAEAKPLDGRSDIYSLGIMMYEMATGTLPFLGYEKAGEIASKHVNEIPPFPSHANPSVSPEIEDIILKAIEKRVEDRYQSADEMLEAIHNIESPAPKNTAPISTKEKLINYFRSFSIPSGVVGGLCALLVSVVMALGILSMLIMNERGLHRYIKVPELEGITYTELDSLGIDMRYYDITPVYTSSPENSGKIISQKPRGNKTVKLQGNKKCEISVKVGYLPLPQKMPNLVAMDAEEAISLLESYDCEITIEKAPHEYISQGRVFATSPSANAESSKKVTLFISTGYSQVE